MRTGTSIRREGHFPGTVFGFFLLLLGAVLPVASAKDNHTTQAAALFSGQEISRLEIEISKDDMAALRAQKKRGDSPATRTNVFVTVREGGRLYTNVSLHMKGSASFRPVDQKPALTLSFDKVDEAQRFHGLQKISLNNSMHDAAFLCELLGREMFTAAGIPVPRVTHAMVELNGRDLGMFVLVEGWNKQFLKHHFADAGGNLYERGSGANEVNKRLAVKTGDAPDDRRALEALAEAAEEKDLPKRWAALERTLDLDRFINGMALEIMIGHWDGYCRNQNNFRVFHDRTQNRLVFLPHGMDQLFALKTRSFADTPIMPQMRGLVAAAIMETPEGRRRYVAALEELNARVFDVAALTNRVVEVAARLRPLLLASNPDALRTNETLVASLLKRIPERHESLGRQITALKIPWQPGGRELADLSRWESRRDTGNPNFTKQSARLETSLQITGSGTGTSAGSWRTTLLLESGRYRFEAQVSVEETKGKSLRPDGVASLRSSEGDAGASVSLPQTATNLTHEFNVATTRYVDLIVQYRGSSGKAVFGGESLSLVRLADSPRVNPPALRRGKPDNR